MHRRSRAGRSRGPIFLCIAALLSVFPRVVLAQYVYQTPVEVQETDIWGFGARALGMGNAMVGLADDGAAMFWNPAGLGQLENSELTIGGAHDVMDRRTAHIGLTTITQDHTRLGEVALAIPLKTHRYAPPTMTLAFGFHRYADLDDIVAREGLLVAPTSGNPGLYEFERYNRQGALDAWSTALGIRVAKSVYIGGSLRLLTGNSSEEQTLANYRATDGGGGNLILDVGDPSNPDPRAFEEQTSREADAWGVTGSIGFLVKGNVLRLGGVVDLPATLEWEGDSFFRLEDTEKIDTNLGGYPDHFQDDMTLPLSLSGGASLDISIVTVAASVRWTDYQQLDYEGEIVAPPDGTSLLPRPAYREVVAYHAGAEARLGPFRGRAGYMVDPIPYRLIAADPNFTFVPDDGDPNTPNDASIVARDYPDANIVTDRHVYCIGAGIEIENAFTLDGAYALEEWERRTPAGYENSTTFYPTTPAGEKGRDERFMLSATVRFR
jgi:hypothetical protein